MTPAQELEARDQALARIRCMLCVDRQECVFRQRHGLRNFLAIAIGSFAFWAGVGLIYHLYWK